MTEHDYTIMGWGHSCSIKRSAGPEDNLFNGYIFGRTILPGDTVLLKMESGKIGILKLDVLRLLDDPDDMAFIDEAHFIGYKE